MKPGTPEYQKALEARIAAMTDEELIRHNMEGRTEEEIEDKLNAFKWQQMRHEGK